MKTERKLKDNTYKKVIDPKHFIKYCRYCDNCKNVIKTKLDENMVIYEYQIKCLINNNDCKDLIKINIINPY